jgi:hypothetical protein
VARQPQLEEYPCRGGGDFAGFEYVSDWSDQETRDPLYADDRNFYKVEKWTRDGSKVDRLLYAGNNLDKARDIFAGIKHRPRIRLTIRQRTRLLRQYSI